MTELSWLDRLDRVSLCHAVARSGILDADRWTAGIESATSRESLIIQCRRLVNWVLPEGSDPKQFLDVVEDPILTRIVRVATRIEDRHGTAE